MEIRHVQPSGSRLTLRRRSAFGTDTDSAAHVEGGAAVSRVARTDGPRIEDLGVKAGVVVAPDGRDEPAGEADRREIRGAIAMVTQGFALGIVLCGLQDPESAAASLAKEAADAGLCLRLAPNANKMDLEVRRP